MIKHSPKFSAPEKASLAIDRPLLPIGENPVELVSPISNPFPKIPLLVANYAHNYADLPSVGYVGLPTRFALSRIWGYIVGRKCEIILPMNKLANIPATVPTCAHLAQRIEQAHQMLPVH
jgi:hypothetical protein